MVYIPDLTRLLVAQIKEFRARVAALTSELGQSIKEMPIFALLKEKVRIQYIHNSLIKFISKMNIVL